MQNHEQIVTHTRWKWCNFMDFCGVTYSTWLLLVRYIILKINQLTIHFLTIASRVFVILKCSTHNCAHGFTKASVQPWKPLFWNSEHIWRRWKWLNKNPPCYWFSTAKQYKMLNIFVIFHYLQSQKIDMLRVNIHCWQTSGDTGLNGSQANEPTGRGHW